MALYVNKETLELLRRITPHLCGPASPAASTVSVHSGAPNSSGAVATSIVARAAVMSHCAHQVGKKVDRSRNLPRAWGTRTPSSVVVHGPGWAPFPVFRMVRSHHLDTHLATVWQLFHTGAPARLAILIAWCLWAPGAGETEAGPRSTRRTLGRYPFHTTSPRSNQGEWIHSPSDVGTETIHFHQECAA